MLKYSMLDERDIELSISLDDKKEAIEYVGEILVKNEYVDNHYIDLMLQREEVTTSYIGNHVAIPHGVVRDEDLINNSGMSLITVPEGVDFNGETAYIIIGIAGKNNEHLEMLSKIAIAFMDKKNVDMVRNSESKEDIINMFNNIEN